MDNINSTPACVILHYILRKLMLHSSFVINNFKINTNKIQSRKTFFLNNEYLILMQLRWELISIRFQQIFEAGTISLLPSVNTRPGVFDISPSLGNFFSFLKNSESFPFIIFHSVVSPRNSAHFKHHCLCQSRDSFSKKKANRMFISYLYIYFLFSRYFNKTTIAVQATFSTILKSWWRLIKTETF